MICAFIASYLNNVSIGMCFAIKELLEYGEIDPNIMCAKYAHMTRIGENDMLIDKISKYAKNAYPEINNQ